MSQTEIATVRKNMTIMMITPMIVMTDIAHLMLDIVHLVTGMDLQKLQHTLHLPHHMKLLHLHTVLLRTKHHQLLIVLLHMIRKY